MPADSEAGEMAWLRRGSLCFHFVQAKAGGAEGSRTPDLLIANEALYQLSYDPSLAVLTA